MSSSKTVYLIRHAESAENVLMQGVVRSLNDLQGGLLLAKNAVTGGNDQCPLSPAGELQVAEVRQKMQENKQEYFGEGVERALLENKLLVAHSPMLRAKQTCLGLITSEVFSGHAQIRDHWMELELLREMLPVEMLDSKSRSLAPARIAEFETWLDNRPETLVFVVGHSHYFREMLGVGFKFSNCEVWRSTFVPRETGVNRWTNLERVCGSSTAQATFGAEGPDAWSSKKS
ncbi:hypothetical protein BASA81_000853 [Batrachochytrium salamandrivorans]|nr:hypothetical protein BASA81_000853 [Batrachochytrium salamandrivorans]